MQELRKKFSWSRKSNITDGQVSSVPWIRLCHHLHPGSAAEISGSFLDYPPTLGQFRLKQQKSFEEVMMGAEGSSVDAAGA